MAYGPPKSVARRMKKLAAKRHRAEERAFKPLAVEIGWIAYEWNRLHTFLGDIFILLVVGISTDESDLASSPARAAWHSLTNERSQRDMIQAALHNRYNLIDRKPAFYDELIWLLEQLKQRFSGYRNDALHAPFLIDTTWSDKPKTTIVPFYSSGNLRAESLKNKNVLAEFQRYKTDMKKLSDYAESIVFAIEFDDFALPHRPILHKTEVHPQRQSPQKNKNKEP